MTTYHMQICTLRCSGKDLTFECQRSQVQIRGRNFFSFFPVRAIKITLLFFYSGWSLGVAVLGIIAVCEHTGIVQRKYADMELSFCDDNFFLLSVSSILS